MSTRIRILLIVGTILFFLMLLNVIRKDKLTLDVACFWIVLSLILIVMAIFPDIPMSFGSLIGIMSPTNALFIVLIFILLCLIFFMLVKISELEKKINNLVQRYAIDQEEKKEDSKK